MSICYGRGETESRGRGEAGGRGSGASTCSYCPWEQTRAMGEELRGLCEGDTSWDTTPLGQPSSAHRSFQGGDHPSPGPPPASQGRRSWRQCIREKLSNCLLETWFLSPQNPRRRLKPSLTHVPNFRRKWGPWPNAPPSRCTPGVRCSLPPPSSRHLFLHLQDFMDLPHESTPSLLPQEERCVSL